MLENLSQVSDLLSLRTFSCRCASQLIVLYLICTGSPVRPDEEEGEADIEEDGQEEEEGRMVQLNGRRGAALALLHLCMCLSSTFFCICMKRRTLPKLHGSCIFLSKDPFCAALHWHLPERVETCVDHRSSSDDSSSATLHIA